ncbi:hypothetical protein ERX35_007970 [Macrococcus equipercicus]|uniref:YopX protein domain-containing protein n=1 Tax=Macrococcus equipercicus TaxID=69967 RepID=A0ABQ6R7R7_9STAP|nr:YopX family protein [Macrococcus equipercicus]KAA1039142.1 hypothetical protein ERX35_007970 [Macrococcus equipercicus]
MIPKFRVLNKYNKKMYPVLTIDFESKIISMLDHELMDCLEVPLEDEYLMQSTGLTDKNSVEIFEGDIVRCFIDLSEYEWIGKVEKFTHDDYPAFDIEAPNGFWYESNIFSHVANSDEELEIIGNIYENPALLKGDEHGTI